MEMAELLAKYLGNGNLEPTLSEEEWLEEQVRAINSREGNLKYIDCQRCKNRGNIAVIRDGKIMMQDCSCMPKRVAMRRMKQSGLEDVITRYRFDDYETPEEWQKAALQKCREYAENPVGWLVMTGNSGTGKTHLCTAVCGELIKKGYDVRYFFWRSEAPTLKAFAGTPEYMDKVEPYKTVKVLYIDDFFKGKVTDGDVNLAFDILNARYNNMNLVTIISSEMTIENILDIDEALGSRIYERNRTYIKTTGKPNWRLRDVGEC